MTTQQTTEAPGQDEAWREPFRAATLARLEEAEALRLANVRQRQELQDRIDSNLALQRQNYEATRHCPSRTCRADHFEVLPATVQYQRINPGVYEMAEVASIRLRCMGCGQTWLPEELDPPEGE